MGVKKVPKKKLKIKKLPKTMFYDLRQQIRCKKLIEIYIR